MKAPGEIYKAIQSSLVVRVEHDSTIMHQGGLRVCIISFQPNYTSWCHRFLPPQCLKMWNVFIHIIIKRNKDFQLPLLYFVLWVSLIDAKPKWLIIIICQNLVTLPLILKLAGGVYFKERSLKFFLPFFLILKVS